MHLLVQDFQPQQWGTVILYRTHCVVQNYLKSVLVLGVIRLMLICYSHAEEILVCCFQQRCGIQLERIVYLDHYDRLLNTFYISCFHKDSVPQILTLDISDCLEN